MEGAGSPVEIESGAVGKSPEVNGIRNPIGEIVLLDLKQSTGGIGRVDNKNIGTVLGQLRREVEGGVSLDQKGIKVHSSVAELLPPELSQPLETDVVCHNESIPREEDPLMGKKDYFIDEKTGKVFDGDAYGEVLELHKRVYGERANVKLVRYNGTLVTVTEQRIGDNLRIIQVLDCDFPETAAYREFRRKVREENIDPAS